MYVYVAARFQKRTVYIILDVPFIYLTPPPPDIISGKKDPIFLKLKETAMEQDIEEDPDPLEFENLSIWECL
jgi:hypothetical protein